MNTYRPGATGALLDEYERAIKDLQKTIESISDEQLIQVMDEQTTDQHCSSIQTVLSHVVNSGYGYATNIQKLRGEDVKRPPMTFYSNAKEYAQNLANVFAYTVAAFKDLSDTELEQPDTSRKILTSWGQTYDIEQMMEHAIVHVLRHRRQIEKFISIQLAS